MKHNFKLLLTLILSISILTTAKASILPPIKPDSFSIEGRWDMTVYMSGKTYPSWLEVRHPYTGWTFRWYIRKCTPHFPCQLQWRQNQFFFAPSMGTRTK